MSYYIQVNKDGYITDCITQPRVNYLEVEFPEPPPNNFINGTYRYVGNNQVVLDGSKLITTTELIKSLRADMDYLSIMTEVDLGV